MQISQQIPSITTGDKNSLQKFIAWVYQFLQAIVRVIDNGNLGFGDGTTSDNIAGTWITYTTNATPNVEDTINHNLGVVPIGYLVVVQNAAGVLYKSTTTWTTTQMFLKCSVGSVTVTIFVLRPSNQGF